MSTEITGAAPVRRPGLPPVFTCSLFLWASCAVAYSGGAERTAAENGTLAVGLVSLSLVLAACALWRRARLVSLACAAAAAGAALGCVQASSMLAAADAYASADRAAFSLEVVEDSRQGSFGEVALVRGSCDGFPEAVFSARIVTEEPLLCGDRISGEGEVAPIDPAADGYAWRDGSCARVVVREPERVGDGSPLGPLRAFRAWAIGFIGGETDAACLLQAIVCGYRRNVSGTAMYSDFQTCGLAHLVAVSGAHLVIVTGLAASVLKAVRAPRRLTLAVLIAVMASYYVVAGMPVSALRASIMSALGLTSFLGRRRSSSLNSVGIGVFAILVADPTASVSASFALSALATMGIILFGPLFRSWADGTPLRHCPPIAESLALTAAASVLSQPYACSLFSQLPLVSPIANALCAPLFPVTCFTGLAAVLLGWPIPSAGHIAAALGRAAATALQAVVSAVSAIPFSAVPVSISAAWALALSAAAGAALWVLWPLGDVRRVLPAFSGAAAALAVASVVLFPQPGDRIVMLDVGQGDAILVQSRGQTMLIDTGNHDTALLGELARNGIVHLDSVLITHADDDHCGSLDALRRAVNVDRVIVASGMGECGDAAAGELMREAGMTAGEVLEVGAGDRFGVGAFTATVVWPHELAEGGGNADSLCLVLEYDGNGDGRADCTALMTGDAEKDELASMLREGTVGRVDILKVGHHGSRNGMTEDEVLALSPRIALISCGLNNRYGHPTQEILDLLDEAGAAVYRTDRDGAVTCSLAPGRVVVSVG